MFLSLRSSALLSALSAILIAQVQAIPKVTRAGRYLYQEDGTRFYIKGIAYQMQGEVVQSADNPFGEPHTFIDPLASADTCARDLPYLKQLSVNAIRVYSVDSTLNHDACMKAFSDAGIYTIIDLSTPLNGSIDRLAPSWSTNLLDHYLKTVDAFSKYDNVLAYNVGNEVVLSDSTQVASYVKAAARDVKAYLKSKKSDALIGYAAINGASGWRNALANYLSCDTTGGDSDATAIDLYGLNDYSWCGDSSFQGAYAATVTQFANYNVAAYFSEYGCITAPPRLWTEVASLLSSDMSPVWSGGIAFSYFPARSAQGEFGMVTISSDGKTVTTGEDFDRLKTQYGAASGPNSPSRASSPASTYGACAAPSSTFLASNTLPATPNDSACRCLENALSCRFTPASSNYTAVVGELLDTGCSMLGQVGASCTDIGGDSQTGVYGRLSGCDPTVKLSYVMSQYYEAQKRNAQACSFGGNGTVNAAASATQSAVALASSCVANPSATFAPSSPATATGTRTGSGSSSSGTGRSNGSVSIFAETSAFAAMGVMALVGVASAAWTLV